MLDLHDFIASFIGEDKLQEYLDSPVAYMDKYGAVPWSVFRDWKESTRYDVINLEPDDEGMVETVNEKGERFHPFFGNIRIKPEP